MHVRCPGGDGRPDALRRTVFPENVCDPVQVEWPSAHRRMEPLREIGKLLLVVGIVLVGAGAFLVLGGRLPFRLGRLPGDISYQGRNGSCYFPIATCVVVSLALTLLFWIMNLFRR
jgi:hypothetical protein